MADPVYHGTSERAAEMILSQGIKPRGLSRKRGNWSHTVQSNLDLVYLTRPYGPYFALSAINSKRDGRPTVIEVDLTLLDESNLHPDEDFIAHALKLKPEHAGRTLAQLNRWVIEHAHQYHANWRLSLDKLGNVGHDGVVPVSGITRAVAFDTKKQPRFASDSLSPTITTLNYSLCGEHYRALTAWLFGHAVAPELLAFSTPMPADTAHDVPWMLEAFNQAKKQYASREGIEFILERNVRAHGR